MINEKHDRQNNNKISKNKTGDLYFNRKLAENVNIFLAEGLAAHQNVDTIVN
jgi:hypothetical protein